MKQAPSHQIVIVGGGTGGLELAVRLARSGQRDVLLVDHDELHVWKPRLHELAAGFDDHVDVLDYAGIAETWGFAFHQGELVDLDPKEHRITLDVVKSTRDETLVPARQVGYQILVLALGGVTPDLGVTGVLDHALLLDGQDGARRIYERFSAGLLCQALEGKNSAPLHIAIVGSGATGVELGAHFATDYVCKALAPARSLPGVDIAILEATDTFMPAMDDTVRTTVIKRLREAGVGVHTSQQVNEVCTDHLCTADGHEFPADLTVWATGRVGPPVAGNIPALATNKKRQWNVSRSLQTPAFPDIFAMGDCAYIDDAPLPPTAQVATEQAKYLAHAIPRFLQDKEPKDFDYHDRGTLLSLGASGNLGKISTLFGHDVHVNGRLARAAYHSLQRQHQRIVMGAYRGTTRMIGDLIVHRVGPRMKIQW